MVLGQGCLQRPAELCYQTEEKRVEKTKRLVWLIFKLDKKIPYFYSSKNFRLFYRPEEFGGLEVSVSRKFLGLLFKETKLKNNKRGFLERVSFISQKGLLFLLYLSLLQSYHMTMLGMKLLVRLVFN